MSHEQHGVPSAPDRRERVVKVEGRWLDVIEVGRYISRARFENRVNGRGVKGQWDGVEYWGGVNVKVVAWKKE